MSINFNSHELFVKPVPDIGWIMPCDATLATKGYALSPVA